MTNQHEHQAHEHETDETRFMAWLSQLQADVAESVGGTLLRGARPVQVGDTAGATRRPSTSGGSVVGYSLHNSGANPVVVYLRDGSDSTGDIVAVVQLPAGVADSGWYGPGGLNVAQGVYVDYPAGAGLEGAVYLRGTD